MFQTRHFADVPALHGPALPFRPAAYLADPEVQDSITVRSDLLPLCSLEPPPCPRLASQNDVSAVHGGPARSHQLSTWHHPCPWWELKHNIL